MIQLKSERETLEGFRELLKAILQRLERIEKMLYATGVSDAEVVSIASKLILAFSLPALRAYEITSRILNLIGSRRLDDISKTIIEVLAVKGPQTISELTRNVREIRGTASRRIIGERIRKLEEIGIIETERRGTRVIVKLSDENG